MPQAGSGSKVFLPTPWTQALKGNLKYPYAKMASPDKLPQQFPSSLRSEVSRVALAFCTNVQRLHTTQLGFIGILQMQSALQTKLNLRGH